ncbi:hypothetical protein DSUL_90052 [Desulfovibrionales bacterium]
MATDDSSNFFIKRYIIIICDYKLTVPKNKSRML